MSNPEKSHPLELEFTRVMEGLPGESHNLSLKPPKPLTWLERLKKILKGEDV